MLCSVKLTDNLKIFKRLSERWFLYFKMILWSPFWLIFHLALGKKINHRVLELERSVELVQPQTLILEWENTEKYKMEIIEHLRVWTAFGSHRIGRSWGFFLFLCFSLRSAPTGSCWDPDVILEVHIFFS